MWGGMTMYCHKCGTKNKTTDIFCQNCGEKLYPCVEEKANKVANGISSSKSVGKELLETGVKVGAKTVKKGHSLAFKVGIFASIFTVIIALINFYFSYMVPTPDGVVKTFLEAGDKGDYKTMFSCFDPKSQELLSIGGDLASSFIGGVTGFNFDFDTANTISSAFGEYLVTEEQKCHATNFKVESIEGEKLSAFVKEFGTKIKSIGNVLGSTAVVSFEVDNKPACVASSSNTANAITIPSEAKRIRYKVEVKNYGSEGWKIPGDVKFEFVEAVN